MRFFIKPAKAAIDFQLETIGQFGTVQATTTANSQNLSHTAWYQHVDVGYTIDMPWSPRLALEYDYASGDQNPNDNKDQRFDTLYGARRFEFGPTGIYGAFSRSQHQHARLTASTFRRAPMCKLRLAIAHSGWHRQKIAGAAYL